MKDSLGRSKEGESMKEKEQEGQGQLQRIPYLISYNEGTS